MKTKRRFRERAITMLLVLVMLFSMISPCIVVIAEDEIDEAKSAIGSLVRINTDQQIYLYSDVTYSGPSTKTQTFYPSELPETLKIVDAITVSYGTVFYKLGTVDGSSHNILDNYSWIKSLLVEIVSDPEPDDGLVRGKVGLEMDGEAISSLLIKKGEKYDVLTNLDSEITGTPMYGWQVLINKEENRWAEIMYNCYPYLSVTEALVANALDESGKATLRCIVTADETKYVSGELTVTLEQPAANLLAAEGVSQTTFFGSAHNVTSSGVAKAQEEYTEFQIEVNYRFLHTTAVDPNQNNKLAGETVTITLGTGSSYSGEITSPPNLGYKPYVTEDIADKLKMDKTNRVEYPKESGNFYVYAPEIKFDKQADAITVMVYYIPQQVNFMVRIHEQNLLDDNYTMVDTIVISDKLADSAIGEELDKPREGFEPLFYDPKTPITGDGATVIDIYYDRIYYLVDFDLKAEGGTGYGVVPMYVRYNTQVMIGTPTNPGYTFDGWELIRVYTVDPDDPIKVDSITSLYDVKNGGSLIYVKHNVDYKALWQVATASYTIIYWRENANDNGFSIWTTETATGYSGSTVDVSNKRVPNGTDEDEYFTYNEALSDESVTIKGDGTAAANIYYTRNIYHIVFRAGTEHGASNCRIALHTHGTDCCSVEGCDHTSGTCQIEMYCTKEEHTHTDECNYRQICGMVEHTAHTNQCTIVCGKDAHTHVDGCYSHNNLTCYTTNTKLTTTTGGNTSKINNPQSGFIYRYRSGNTYNNYFYLNGTWYNLGNGNNNGVITDDGLSFSGSLNNVSNNWYKSVQATPHNNSDACLSCGKDSHAHSDSCRSCTLHTHTDACYTSDCNKVAHKHSDGCYQSCIRYEHTHDGCTRYLYAISAKYNADIADIWPIAKNVEEWKAKGWLNNGIYYRRWTGNGNWVTKRVDMTEELCNDISSKTWVLTLETYNYPGQNTAVYMFESLEQTAGEGRVLYRGTYYEQNDRYTQPGISSTSLTAKEILGMTDVSSDDPLTLYYKRNSYTLTFVNGSVAERSMSIKYEAPLTAEEYVPEIPSSYEENSVYFAGWYTTQACADGTEFDFSSGIMPASNLYLYAKWAPTEWNVKAYNDKEIMETDPSNTLMNETVPFGAMIDEPTYKKINENYIFAGWYYVEDGKEERFDFKTMQVKKNLVIYAKWTSKVPVPYTIYYKAMVDGVWVDIAKPSEGQSLAAISKSFTAKVGEDLYEKYRKGYYPTARSVSLMMSAEHENEYTFIYQTVEKNSYTVHHTFTDENFVKILGTDTFSFYKEHQVNNPAGASPLISVSFREMVEEDNVKKAIREQYPSLDDVSDKELEDLWSWITELSPNAYMHELILVPDPTQNIVEFNWTNRHSSAIYEIIYKIKNLDDDGYSTHIILQGEDTIGHTVSIDPKDAMDIPGFEFNATHTGNVPSATLLKPLAAGGGTTLVLHYDRVMYTYTVDYYERGTMEKLHDTVTKQVLYETVVTEKASDISIPGYHVVGESSVTEEITVQNQAIAFYYEADDIQYFYRVGVGKGNLSSYGEKVNIIEAPMGSIPTPNKGYVFAGWYTDASCTVLVTDDVALVDTTAGVNYGKITPVNPTSPPDDAIYFYAKFVPHQLTIQNSFSAATASPPDNLDIGEQAFIYTITGVGDTPTAGIQVRVVVIGYGSQTIFGLPAGEYTIAVESQWSWRYDTIAEVEIDESTPIPGTDIENMTWTIDFDGSATVRVRYGIPGEDVAEPDGSNGYFYITDNASSET